MSTSRCYYGCGGLGGEIGFIISYAPVGSAFNKDREQKANNSARREMEIQLKNGSDAID